MGRGSGGYQPPTPGDASVWRGVVVRRWCVNYYPYTTIRQLLNTLCCELPRTPHTAFGNRLPRQTSGSLMVLSCHEPPAYELGAQYEGRGDAKYQPTAEESALLQEYPEYDKQREGNQYVAR